MDNFKFENIGKDTPYRVPDSYFEDFESRIAKKTVKPAPRLWLRRFLSSPLTAAASLTLLLLAANAEIMSAKDDFMEVAQAFDNLSEEDQSFLLEVYQDEDLFINQ